MRRLWNNAVREWRLMHPIDKALAVAAVAIFAAFEGACFWMVVSAYFQ